MDSKLEKYLAVVEYGGLTQAANHLHISQPALSVAMRNLEKNTGATLLQRTSKGVRLTGAGRIVYDMACRIRNEQRTMALQLEAHATGKSRLLHLGLLDTIASLLFASPHITLPARMAVMVDNSDRLLKDVGLGRIDAAIVTAEPDEAAHNVMAKRLRAEQFAFVATPEVATGTDPRRITNWLAFNPTSHTYAQFVRSFEQREMVVLPTFHSTSMELIRSMALAGKGVGLLPRHFVADQLKKRELTALITPAFARDLWYVRQASQPEQQPIRQLVQTLENLL